MTPSLFELPQELQDKIFRYCLQDVDLEIIDCMKYEVHNDSKTARFTQSPDLRFERACRYFYNVSRSIRSQRVEWQRLTVSILSEQLDEILSLLSFDKRYAWPRRHIRFIRIYTTGSDIPMTQGWGDFTHHMKALERMEVELLAERNVSSINELRHYHGYALWNATKSRDGFFEYHGRAIVGQLSRCLGKDVHLEVTVRNEYMFTFKRGRKKAFHPAFKETWIYVCEPRLPINFVINVDPIDFQEVCEKIRSLQHA